MLKIKQIQFMFTYNTSIGKNVISVALNVSYLVVRYRIVLDVDDVLTFSHTIVSELAWCGEKKHRHITVDERCNRRMARLVSADRKAMLTHAFLLLKPSWLASINRANFTS